LADFVKKITKSVAGQASRERTGAVGYGAVRPDVEPAFELATYYPIFLYFLAIVGMAITILILAHASWLKPKKRTPVKLMPYESGMDPVGDARRHFDVKFYLIAILFLVFDVELLFLYPWAVAAYREQGTAIPPAMRTPVFWEILAFLLTLVVAYVYAWRKGVFKWR
jgi:NADH:ubiquinone oxidoreductase subunit 3 (subunit A)